MPGVTRVRPSDGDITVIVSGGTGSASFFMTGHINDIVFDDPAGGSGETFNVSLSDRNSKGIKAQNNLTTEAVWTVDKDVNGKATIAITSASVDGSWNARIRYERGI